MDRLQRLIEAAIFISPEPISVERLAALFGASVEEVAKVVELLKEEYSGRGIILKKIAGGWKFFTAPDLSPMLQAVVEDKPVKLSAHLLEVLAIVAYNQPVTKKEINRIRGKNSEGALKSLLEKGFIEVAGRAKLPGRPKLYRTTDSFLYHFGLSSLDDLPPIELEEFEGEKQD